MIKDFYILDEHTAYEILTMGYYATFEDAVKRVRNLLKELKSSNSGVRFPSYMDKKVGQEEYTSGGQYKIYLRKDTWYIIRRLQFDKSLGEYASSRIPKKIIEASSKR